jgi:hypothetical protein
MRYPGFLFVAALAASLALFLGLSEKAAPANASTGYSAASCQIGHLATVKKFVLAALSKKAYDKAVAAAVAHDNVGLHKLFLSGQFVSLDKGALVRIIYGDFTHIAVRVLRDRQTPYAVNKKVWVDCSWLSPK